MDVEAAIERRSRRDADRDIRHLGLSLAYEPALKFWTFHHLYGELASST
jgi:hypothetical protein